MHDQPAGNYRESYVVPAGSASLQATVDAASGPAFVTVIWNGVAVHVRKELIGTTINRQLGKYTAHAPELPLMLQDHGNPIRYRNIWVRRLGGYDQK